MLGEASGFRGVNSMDIPCSGAGVCICRWPMAFYRFGNLPLPMSLPPSHPPVARYLMIGGFLGAGKTTAVGAIAQYLSRKGLRVGLITNDQGSGLVDTALLRSRGFATQEIAGGCFCCRFNSLVEAADRLRMENRPEVIIAEPVGSCTDLRATVTYPLRRMYGTRFHLAPMSVLMDPVRAEQFYGLTPGGKFSEKVLYIWQKQVEEADLLVITKTDLLEPERLMRLQDRLRDEYPRKEIFAVSVRNGVGIEAWFERVLAGEISAQSLMTVDYDLYAEGEALLGWLNATVQVIGHEFDANVLLRSFMHGLQRRLGNVEVAHLKMTFAPDHGSGEIAAINLVRSDYIPELSRTLHGPVSSGQVTVNLRAEANPALLRLALEATVAALSNDSSELIIRLDHVEQFRPARPVPVHRETSLAEIQFR